MAKFILDSKKVIEQVNSLKSLGEVWYNLKTNTEVGKILENQTKTKLVATGFNNLKRISDKKRSVVLLQGETKEQIKDMLQLGVNSFIIDNEQDLNKLQKLTDTANIFLRIKFKEHSVYTGKYFVYGFDWRRAVELVKIIKGNVGIHFHRKTQNVGEWSLVDDLKPIVKELEGLVDCINIGGGLPSTYQNSSPNIKPIFEKIKKLKDFLSERNMKLILEPGRFIAAPSVKLETNVLLAYNKNLVVDASIFNAYMDSFLFNMRLPVEGETKSGFQYLIKGKSPDSLDIFRYKVFFNKEKKEGDKITFLNAGAYNFHTDFSDLERIKTIIK